MPLSGKVLTLRQKTNQTSDLSDLREFELTLVLEDPRVGDNLQVWFYRYDCIVNKEYPDVALELSSVLIRPAKFQCSENQLIDPIELRDASENNLSEPNVG